MNDFPTCIDCVHDDVPVTDPPCRECTIQFFKDRTKPNFELSTMTASNVYDECEIHRGVTVEIWKNSTTGECSIGWYKEDNDDDPG